MKEFCTKNCIKWEECGKIVVAKDENEINRLEDLLTRGQRNNLKGLKLLNGKEINFYEPYLDGKAGIYVPEESIVSYFDVAKKFEEEIISEGGLIKLSSKVVDIKKNLNSYSIILENDEKIHADIIISTSGLYSDKISEIMGFNIDKKKIIPF